MSNCAVLEVLDRASRDWEFIALLSENGSRALEKYDLDREERAALASGDIGWIENRVGKLNGKRRTWLNCRLQQEAW